MKRFIESICKTFNCDKTRLLDIFWAIQEKYSYVPQKTLDLLSHKLKLSIPELKDTLTFYHFFHQKPSGKIIIYVDSSAISEIFGLNKIISSFEQELNCKMGEVDPTGQFGLFKTPCIGMSDQAPAALIHGIPVGKLTTAKIKKIVADLRKNILPKVQIKNKVQLRGPVLFEKHNVGESLDLLYALTPDQIIQEVEDSGIRGRGGAGFSTGKKWRFCAEQKEKQRYIVCNADEGEPGTFKDRYLLTKNPTLVFEGMILAARAIGANQGLIYLRAEYKYLKGHLQSILDQMQLQNLLGNQILDIPNFDFHIRIQLGAGSYVVGEETALLESLEGRRGEPRMRPPFPVEQGYLSKPTIINNVETFASVSKIIKNGAHWYKKFGTSSSPGTKLLSVSGDCAHPGIYEVEWGLSIRQFLKLVGATNTLAVQVGGPSGQCISLKEKNRRLSFDDLPTGGSMMVFSKKRNLLNIIKNFVQFFQDESCGCCLPCRAGNIVLNEQMHAILSSEAAEVDLQRIQNWSKIISASSRCGLGQSCTNPMISSMQAFPEIYKKNVKAHESLYRPFDVENKTVEYEQVVQLHEKES